MKTEEAIAICDQWFAYLKRQQEKSVALQRLATLARTDPKEAQRQLREIDRAPKVYDGARLEPAVRHLVQLARAPEQQEATLLLHLHEMVDNAEDFIGEDRGFPLEEATRRARIYLESLK